MKKIMLWMTATILTLCGTLASCNGNGTTKENSENTEAPTVNHPTDIKGVVEAFLVDSLAKQYSQGEVSIPCVMVISTDSTSADDIKVWGDYWVFNYNVVGDTLKTVSGGNHPGLIHLKRSGDTYEVIDFEQVADGSNNLPSAKKIFGELFAEYQKVQSDGKQREQKRADAIASYVKTHDMHVKMYQDYGWDAVKLPNSAN